MEAYVKFNNGIVWKNLQKALVGVHLLRWIVTYPVDKVIHSLNNWGQAMCRMVLTLSSWMKPFRVTTFKIK